jgi:hypothetical protein
MPVQKIIRIYKRRPRVYNAAENGLSCNKINQKNIGKINEKFHWREGLSMRQPTLKRRVNTSRFLEIDFMVT